MIDGVGVVVSDNDGVGVAEGGGALLDGVCVGVSVGVSVGVPLLVIDGVTVGVTD